MPAISIIIPMYNTEAFIKDCLDSLVAQTFSDFEVIIIDDGSTDESARIAASFASSDARFRLIGQPNKGLSEARNTGLKIMRGDYVMFIDSDDCVAPNFLETYAMLAVGALVFTTLALIQCRGDLSAYLRPFRERSYLLSVGYLSVFCSILCFFLSNYAISKLPVARETVFANLTTAVSVFAGVLFLHEPFSWLTAVCVAVILIGIWGVQRTARER